MLRLIFQGHAIWLLTLLHIGFSRIKAALLMCHIFCFFTVQCNMEFFFALSNLCLCTFNKVKLIGWSWRLSKKNLVDSFFVLRFFYLLCSKYSAFRHLPACRLCIYNFASRHLNSDDISKLSYGLYRNASRCFHNAVLL
jgi:hypothetical protein